MDGTLFKWPIYGGGRFKELEYCYNSIVWAITRDPIKAINIGERSICGGSSLERFYCIYISNLTVHAGLVAVVTRHSWYQVGQEPFAGAAIVAELRTNSYDRMMVGSN